MKEKEKKVLYTITNENQVYRLCLTIEASGSGSGSGSTSGSSSSNESKRKKCFFVVMEYMGSKYGLKDRSYNDYFNEFQNDSTNMNNAYLEEDTVKIGPADYLPIKSEDGKTTESQPNPYTYKYIDKYFETRDNGWQEGEDKLRNYYEEKPASRKGNKVFGVIKIEDNGEEKAHAVVITGVQGNYVDYNDPARGESNQSIGFDKFEYFSVIKGLKKDENE